MQPSPILPTERPLDPSVRVFMPSSPSRRANDANVPGVASGARNASSRAPSSVRSDVSRLVSRTTGSIVDRGAGRAPSSIVPPTRPSTRNVRKLPRMSDSRAAGAPSPIIRVRSLYPSSALSYSGRKRTGAGVSGSGRAAPGQVEQFPSGLVTEDAQHAAGAGRPPPGAWSVRTTPGRPSPPPARIAPR